MELALELAIDAKLMQYPLPGGAASAAASYTNASIPFIPVR
jgi:hypothetical protein